LKKFGVGKKKRKKGGGRKQKLSVQIRNNARGAPLGKEGVSGPPLIVAMASRSRGEKGGKFKVYM